MISMKARPTRNPPSARTRLLGQWWLFALPPQLVVVCDLLLMVPRLEPCIGSLPQIGRIVERNASSIDETMYLLSVLQAQRLLPIERPRGYPLA
jgi:hypothetical protein